MNLPRIACLLAAAALLAGCVTARPLPDAQRPAGWATPVAVDGLDNLWRVDEHLYRSRLPGDAAALAAARGQLGIRTVVNLRALHSDRALAAASGLRAVDVGMEAWDIDDEEVVAALRVLRRREDGPFLLHCRHGADRTGLVVAMYRMVEQGWTREEAIEEMRRGGYGFHVVWTNIVAYLRTVDIARIRAQLEQPAP